MNEHMDLAMDILDMPIWARAELNQSQLEI